MKSRNVTKNACLAVGQAPAPTLPRSCKPSGQQTGTDASRTAGTDSKPAPAYQVQARPPAASDLCLGIHAKSSTTCGTPPGGALVQSVGGLAPQLHCAFDSVDPETGEIYRAPGSFDPAEARLERFALQAVARSILPGHRVGACLRRRQGGKDVELWRAVESRTGHYKGLQTCGSVWACPVCAAKISEKRRAELVAAVATHKAQGGAVLLLTLTNPHYRADKLETLLEGQRAAFNRFIKGRVWQLLSDRIGLVGHVRAWEVTWGQANGWHPHFHVLLFVRAGLDLVELRQKLSTRWADSCEKAGLPRPSDERGIKLDDGTEAARYVGKWGIEQEMTKGHIAKKAKQGRLSPFDALRRLLADRTDTQAAALFQEFASAFHGRRQLSWSNGLKDHFAIESIADERIAEGTDTESVRLGTFTADEWRRVLWVEGRGIVLELAREGWEAVCLYLEGLRALPEDFFAIPKRRKASP